jgi:hypothetical protein
MFSAQMENPFQDRLGGRVLPGFLGVADDPTLRQYEDKPLLGSRRVDDDGVATQRTILVENGILKTLLATRDPVAGITRSTGSRRGGTVAPANLFVTVTGGLPDQAMKAKLQSLVQQRGIPFGVVVARLANPFAVNSQDMMTSLLGGLMEGQGGGGPTQLALVAYKVFPDGHEEPVRNVTVEGVNSAAFKDVVAASATSLVYNAPFLSIRNSMFSVVVGGSPGEASPPLVSYIVPSLLFEDVTLKRSLKENPRLPLSPRPLGD